MLQLGQTGIYENRAFSRKKIRNHPTLPLDSSSLDALENQLSYIGWKNSTNNPMESLVLEVAKCFKTQGNMLIVPNTMN